MRRVDLLIVGLMAYAAASAFIATMTVQVQGEKNRPPLVIAWLSILLVWPLLGLLYGVRLLCTRTIDEIWP